MYKYLIFYEYNYIVSNKKYNPNDSKHQAKYYNAINPHTKKPFKLTEKDIEHHLSGNKTIGVRAKNYTKFMCLDIDTKGEQAKRDAKSIINLLQEEFNISIEHIHVVNSGNKGYHIYLFFDEIVSISNMKKFYLDILNKGQYSSNEVELRPTNMAVKLPLGVNPTTKRVSYFCNVKTLKVIRSFEPLLNIKQMNHKFIEQYEQRYIEHVTKNQQIETNQIVNETELSRDEIEIRSIYVKHLLEYGTLYGSGTRNRATMYTASYLRSRGHSKEYTNCIINEALINTIKLKPGYISTREEDIPIVTAQVVDQVWKHGYTFKGTNNKVTFGIDEIVDCLSIEDVNATKKIHLKKLFFMFLVHSKRHANEIDGCFFFPYSIMARMGNDSNRKRTSENVGILEKLGLIEIVSRNRLNDDPNGLSYINKIKLPNVYKIKKEYNPQSTKIEIVPNEDIKFEKIIYELHKDNVINLKDFFKKRRFYDIQKQYRDAYE